MAVTNQLEIDIKAKSQKATDSLDALISKLNEVNTALNSLNTAKISEISNSIKGVKGVHLNTGGSGSNSNATVNANNRATTSFEKLLRATTTSNRGILNFRSSMFKLAATWGMFYASMYPVIRLFQFMGKEVEHSMDYVETFNYFKVTMNKLGHDAGEEFTEGFYNQIKDLDKLMTGFKIGKNGELIDLGEKNLGIDPNIMMQFQAQIGAVTNSVGLLGQTSVVTQKAMSMLSADLSSLKNEDLQSVMKNLQSGLIGQSRSLYKYGIDITQATLKQYAYEHGVTKSVSAMTQSEKMQLRLLAILDQSKVAWGDQANSIMTVANQYRIMKQQISNLGRTIGNLFLPIVKTVLPYLNAFIISMRRILELFGMKVYGGDWQKDLMEGVSEGNFNGLEESIEDTEDALDGATKSAKKFKQATMGFDELNIINPQTSSGSGSGKSGGGGFDLSGDIEDAYKEYEDAWSKAFDNMQNKTQQLVEKFMKYVDDRNWFGLGDWMGSSLTNVLKNVDWERTYQGAENFGTGLAQFLNGLISPELFYQFGRTVASSINTAIYFALNFGENFDFRNLGKSIGKGINGFFENFDFKASAQTLNVWAKGIGDLFINAVGTIDWTKVFKGLYDFFSHIDIHTINLFLGVAALKGVKKIIAAGLIKELIAKKIATTLGTIKLSDIPVKVTSVSFILNSGITAMFTDALAKVLSGKDLVGNLMPKRGEAPTDYAKRNYENQYGKDTYDKMLKDQEEFDKKYRQGWENLAKAFRENDLFAEIKKSYSDNFSTISDNFSVALENLKKNLGLARTDVVNSVNTMTDSTSKKFDLFSKQWETSVSLWYEKNVKPWFSKERWVQLGVNMTGGLTTKWTKFTEWWEDNGLNKWYKEQVEPIFTVDKWEFEGIGKGLKLAFHNAIVGVKMLWNEFADWINDNLRLDIPSTTIGDKTIGGYHIQLGKLPRFNIPQYAIGGFPEDGLFMANHTELVGQFSNGQTAVANNEQIVEGIRSGVASAVAQTLAPYLREIANNTSDTAHNTDEIAKKPVQTLTDRGIAKANIRGQRSLGMQLRTT